MRKSRVHGLFETAMRVLAAVALPLAGCNGGGGNGKDAEADVEVEGELPDEFFFHIELIPAEGYQAGADLNTVVVTIHDDPPIVHEGLEIPREGPYLFEFEMEPGQMNITAAVTVNGYRSEMEGTVFATGRCPPVRIGDYGVDPETGEPRTLKIFFHRLEEFSLIPDPYRMAFGRTGHGAAVTSDGRIAVVGGATPDGLTRVVELFNPADLAFEYSTTELPDPRSEFAMVKVGEWRHLLVGGRTAQTAACMMDLGAGEVAFEQVTLPAELQDVWANPRAVSLADGSFLLAGADTGPETPSELVVVYEESSGFSLLALTMGGVDAQMDKYHPSLVTVGMSAGERVLVYGGGGTLPAALLLDPGTGELTDAQQAAADARYDHGAGRISMTSDDGSMVNEAVLVMGGERKVDETTYEPAETVYVFIPACLEGTCIMPAAWSNAGPAFRDRPARSGAVVVLEDERVVHIGGRGPDGEAVGTVVAFTARTPSEFYPTNFMLAEKRVSPVVVYYRPTGQYFIIGGEGEGGVPLDSIEVFTPREPEE
jgi:hypothetical protein